MAEKEGESEEIKINWTDIKKSLIKYQVVLLLLIPIFLSIWFRSYSYYLPETENWARSTVYSGIRESISSQIDKEYPDLVEQNRNILVEKEFQKVLKEQKNDIAQQIKETSEFFKSRMQDENGHTYLLAIDPYLWYGHARNYVNNGHFGDVMFEGESVYTLRGGRHNYTMPTEKILSYSEAQLYKIVKIFNPDVSLVSICFVMPLLLITLSVIPAFFIGRRLAGNLGGLFSGIILAIQPFLIGRTSAGFSDTDPFPIFFGLLIMWLFIEAFEAKNRNKKLILSGLSGLTAGLFSWAWKGWWYIIDFILIGLVAYLAYQLLIYRKEIKKGFLKLINSPNIKNIWQTSGTFIFSSGLIVSLIFGLKFFVGGLFAPLQFMRIKEVATIKIWPNVLTTVAEFNEIPLRDIISTMGGSFLFFIALAGIVIIILFSLIKKDDKRKYENNMFYGLLLAIWFVGATYSFTKGARFAILLVPAFAIALGIAIGKGYEYGSIQITKLINVKKKWMVCAPLIVIAFLLVGFSPLPITSTSLPFCTHGLCKSAHGIANSEIPSMNDAWYEALTEIKQDSEDAIITSWWDFGHWFVTIAERRVTFDGADQRKRIYWVGKSLLTDNEQEAIGILRMLNCDQDGAYEKLEDYSGDDLNSVLALNEMVKTNGRAKAKAILKDSKLGLTDEQIKDVLDSTHCDNLIDQYYIASEDMIGKSGVWGHFGSWDFKKAKMYATVRGKKQAEGIKILEEEFGLSENETFTIYHEIQNTEADQWVSGWPGYLSEMSPCTETEETIICNNGLQFNKITRNAFFQTQQGIKYPNSIVYPIENEKEEKSLFEKTYITNTLGFSALLIPLGDEGFVSAFASPELAFSMFTRMFFYEGRGLKNFELLTKKEQFNGMDIYVYKVDLE